MWGFLVLAAMLAVTGVYSFPVERNQAVVQEFEVRKAAENMALYREAVVRYFDVNNVTNTSVTIDDLKTAGHLPNWTTVSINSALSNWANFRDAAGTIYIYPAVLPSSNMVTAVLEVSEYSSLVAVYRAVDTSLYFSVDGQSVIATSLSGIPIPDGAPVWIATRG